MKLLNFWPKEFSYRLRGAFLQVVASTALNNLVSFITQALAARILGPESFGVFSLSLSLAMFVGTIGDAGLGLTTIRFFGERDTAESKERFLNAILLLRIFVFLILFLLSAPIGWLISRVLGVEGLSWLIVSSAIITGGLVTLWIHLQSVLRSRQNFRAFSSTMALYSILRLLAISLLLLFKSNSPLTWLVVTYILPLALALVFSLGRGSKRIQKVRVSRLFREDLSIVRSALKYTQWVALSSLSYTAIPHAVQFLLAVRGSIEEVAYFATGLLFSMVFSTLNVSVRTILFPRVVGLTKKDEALAYLEKLRSIVPYYVLFSLLVVLSLFSVQEVLLGKEYLRAQVVFLALSLGFMAVIFLGLATMLIHTIKRPEVDGFVNLVRLILASILVYILAPEFGALGAAVVYMGIIIGGEIWMLWYVRRQLAQ
ncbi:oligosaccharide flippase family protein [Thermus sp.]|uniref:lipopolysaccharide biosynthesis protein n=1 Tax=Thermus sp. TaxID=275 RepID=UPI00307F2E9A